MITTINTAGLFVIIIITVILGYIAGLRRGITGSQHLYDDGWLAAEEYFKRFPELVEEEDDEDKYDKARRMIRELDDLFNEEDEEDDVEILDGGEY